ncbi:hypothetical protein EJ994_03135 [Maribacter sp. MJ134]|uniref:DUF6090 family protein n=1 Tax=Maribacter sp. MJ134 TaxID=2496865 RepID=UPI000F82076B|nr:DUF6090 family protein [Maribacter sp. MJ134]AZQ57844.1 hypothetical protein EJ994_03135 [Maribacter sp. MJ134]
MIKFFRKIRQKLLAENRFSKYLLYAIGEIVLVVIGILIALQINNWNENEKIKAEEKIIIAGLIQNIEDDIKNLIRVKKNDSIFIDANRILLSALKNDSIKENKPLLKQKIYDASFSSSFIPSQITFNQMQFSGKLKYILNDSIKSKIQAYYDNVSNVLEGQESNLNLIYGLAIELIPFLDINSALQNRLPDFAKMEMDAFDNSFFYEATASDRVKEFVDKSTLKQALMVPVYRTHSELLQEGIALRESMFQYIDEK